MYGKADAHCPDTLLRCGVCVQSLPHDWVPERHLINTAVAPTKFNEWLSLQPTKELKFLDTVISHQLLKWQDAMLQLKATLGDSCMSIVDLVIALGTKSVIAEVATVVQTVSDIESGLFRAVEDKYLFMAQVGLAMATLMATNKNSGNLTEKTLPLNTPPRQLHVFYPRTDVVWIDGCPPLATIAGLKHLASQCSSDGNEGPPSMFRPLEKEQKWHVAIAEGVESNRPVTEVVVTSAWRADRWAVQAVSHVSHSVI